MDNNNDGMNNGGQGAAPADVPMNNTPVNDAPVEGGAVEMSAVQPSDPTSEPASAPVSEPVAPEPIAPAQDTPAPAPIAAPATTPAPTSDPVSTAGGSPAPTTQKKSNSKLIILVAGIVVVLVAVIVTLVIVLINNNNKSSKSQGSKGSSYYEEDDDKDEIGGGWSDDDSSTGSAGTISCFGYQFEKQAGYEYACEDGALGVHNSTFGVYLEPVSGMSYYQAEGHASELAANLGQQGTVRGYRNYTTSSGRKMLVFDMGIEGVNVYTFITAASSSSVLTGMVVNASGSVSASDLEKADAILGGSTISSRLPEDGEVDDSGDMPAIDWDLKALEL